MTRNDLAYVSVGGDVHWVMFAHQPTTTDIANHIQKRFKFVVQLIGGVFYVYDLNTLRRFTNGTTIGIPVFSSKDFDAAIMFAALNTGSV